MGAFPEHTADGGGRQIGCGHRGTSLRRCLGGSRGRGCLRMHRTMRSKSARGLLRRAPVNAVIPTYILPTPYALCPMPYALCPNPYTLIPDP